MENLIWTIWHRFSNIFSAAVTNSNSLTSPVITTRLRRGYFKRRSRRIAVFIDGSNLYSKLKELSVQNSSRFDYWNFILYLTGGVRPVYVGYYVGQIRRETQNTKSLTLYENQQKMFLYLHGNIPNINIIKGQIQNFNGIYKEKGVDVRLALDLFKLASENRYDLGIMISSDNDLIPSVQMAQKLQKHIKYIGFRHNPSVALIEECHYRHLLDYNDVRPFEYHGD